MKLRFFDTSLSIVALAEVSNLLMSGASEVTVMVSAVHAAELELDALALSAAERDLDLGRAQAFERGADGVVAADQQAEAESAVVAGGGRASALRTAEIDGHARQRCALGVEHTALERAGLRPVGVERQAPLPRERRQRSRSSSALCAWNLLGPSQS